MRFYCEIGIQPLKYLNEICDNPCQVFFRDFVYHLATLHNVEWCPIGTRLGNNSYLPHRMSPCSRNVKQAIKDILSNSILDYDVIYEELVPTEASNKLELYIDRVKNILNKLSNDPVETLFTFLHVGRWTIAFYKHGTKDAADLSIYLMADTLKKILANSSITLWFRNWDLITKDMVELLRSENTTGFSEEYYHYFEELRVEGSLDFDECNICVCGYCGDQNEGSEERKKETDSGEHENSSTESGEFAEVIENDEDKENPDDDCEF